MRKWLDHVERLWCARMHGRPMWPVRGRYQCAVCLREFPVKFEAAQHRVEGREQPFAAPRVVAREATGY